MASFFDQIGDIFTTKHIACIGVHCDTKAIAWAWGHPNRDKAVRSVKERLGSSNCDIYTRTSEGYLAYASGSNAAGELIVGVSSARYKSDAEQGAIDEAKNNGAISVTETRIIHTEHGEC